MWPATSASRSLEGVPQIKSNRTLRTGRLPLLAAAAAAMIPAWASQPPTRTHPYVVTIVLPPGAVSAGAGGEGTGGVGDAMNGSGTVAANAAIASPKCGYLRSFVYFPRPNQYVVLTHPPGLGTANTETIGIARDNSVAVESFACSTHRALIYRVQTVGATPQWSEGCACGGYNPMGYNSDGVGLNSRNRGPAVLSFGNETPEISPLAVKLGIPAKARLYAVGVPAGFVGTQRQSNTHEDVPTVWLRGKPYQLPVARSSKGLPIPLAMVERTTGHGLRIDVVGGFRRAGIADYWRGKPTSDGFVFREQRDFIRSDNIAEAYGISTDGSMVFGDPYWDFDALVIYLTALHREVSNGRGCGGAGEAWGDSHGDVLVDGGPHGSRGMCLARPRH